MPGGLRAVRQKVPTVLQMEATECGAASLAMVLASYGRFEPLEVLREACGVSRDGARASNVVRAARRYGLEARGWRLEPAELWTRRLPMIVHWEFDHFLVVEGRSRRGVHLNDPARGRRLVTDAEFDAGFTGVALLLAPGETFQPGGQPYSLQAALASRLRGSWPALAQTAAAGALLLLPGLVVAGLSRVFVDRVLVASDTSRLGMLVVAAVLCAVMVVLLTTLQRQALVRAQLKMGAVSTARFLRHLLNLPIRFYQQRLPGDLAQRALANNELAALVVGQFAATAISAVAVLAYVVMMAVYDPLLTAVAVAALVANVLVLRQVARRRSTGEQQLALAQGRLRGTTVDGLSTIETLKAAGGESDLFLRWTGQAARASGVSVSLASSGAVLQALPAVFTAVSTAAVLYLGGRAVVAGTVSLGELVAFQLLMAGLLLPIQQLTALSRLAERLSATLRRLDDVLASPAAVTTLPATRPLELRGEVELKGVTFGYARTAPPLLDDFNLHVRPGTRLALVGGSGSGKSTVARLLVGLEQPWAGTVLFDNSVPPTAVPAGALGHVDQEVVLFEGDVWDNLTLWDRSAPEPAVVQAARDACVHDDIVIRPGAYDGQVAEGGHNFSGGQRQRLEIARALVPDPSVLVLDEATSALDPLVEQRIDANLRRRGCTCIIVAHRLSTIRDADEIVLMERGRVIERGSHEQLMAAGGAYLRLLRAEATQA